MRVIILKGQTDYREQEVLMRIHFIQQEERVTPGEYLAWANRHGYPVTYTRCYAYDTFPETAEADFLIILGGSCNPATTKDECPFFDAEAEKTLIRKYVEACKPVLGVCLGAQLVGEALGAEYSHSPECEIGPVKARLTEEGRKDPFFSGFPDTFLAGEWHNDMPGLTEDSVIIAESDGCPRQIVRYGDFVYGFQTHMELTHEIIAAGVKAAGDTLKGGRFIQSAEELLAFDYTEMNAMLAGYLDAMTEKYLGLRD